ncbi:MAG TPA: tripartite tricarboxylate transporter substrate binding protein [Bradyrhizobium sp.]|nr:tripartite tricarboxylate transporter substrate binding protein [Bradyrhizobium sp.]
MDLPRRQFLALAAASVAILPRRAGAEDYPSRAVRIVAGFAAGGGVDVSARLIGQWLSDRLGQPFVIENRTGAGGNIGTEAVLKAAPDGYTLLLSTLPNAVNASLYDRLSFDFLRDSISVAGIVGVPMVMLVNPAVPARNVAEFIAYAKANPDKVNMASAGNGSAPHMAGELFKMMAGVKLVHVPYRGQGPAMSDLLGGQVEVLFAASPGTADYIATGKLRALAVTTAKRAAVLPALPTIGDTVPGYEASQWYGLSAPSRTPPAIVEKLNREVNAALADEAMRKRLAAIGGEPLPGLPAAFAALIAADTEKWAKVVRAAGLKPE